MTIPSRAERIEGTLLGLAWGDVLGCPVEGWTATQIEHVFGRYAALPEVYPLARMPRDEFIRGHLRPLGLHSDDTQQALALLHVCLAPGGFVLARWGEAMVEGAVARAWRGTGRNFRSAVAQIRRGIPASVSGSPSAGVGAAMRIAPLGAVYRDDESALARVVFDASCATHADARAISCAFAIALACARLVRGDEAAQVARTLAHDVEAFEAAYLSVAHAGDLLAQHQHTFSRALAEALAFADAPAALVDLLETRARDYLDDTRELTGLANHPLALLGGIHALVMGLSPGAVPAQTLAAVIRVGNDADTVGAIAGGVLGARFGVDWIPRARMSDEPMLSAYARGLVAHTLPESYPALLQREAASTRRERAFLAQMLASAHSEPSESSESEPNE